MRTASWLRMMSWSGCDADGLDDFEGRSLLLRLGPILVEIAIGRRRP